MATYDGNWTVTLDAAAAAAAGGAAPEDRGPLLANGKLGVLPGVLGTRAQATLMTMPLRYANGVYRANVVEAFSVDAVRLFGDEAASPAPAVASQALNMYTGVLTTAYAVTDPATGGAVDVQADLYCPQHLPFCVVQTLRVTPRQDVAALDLFHELQAKDNLVGATYNNNVIAGPAGAAATCMLTGTAATRAEPDTRLAVAAGYLFETATPAENLGFNVYREDAGRCYNRFRLRDLTAGATVRVHVVSALLSSYDFDAPLEEARRIVLSLCSSPAGPAAAASRIRAGHTAGWARLWQTDVTIAPKAGITAAEEADVQRLKRALRQALYTLYASTRTNVSLEVNPLNLSVLDQDGSALYSGDLWLIPALILLRPEAARGLLEHRHRLLATARQLAAGFGYRGAKFPYLTDVVGYKTALYWDASGPMAVFNNALVAVNVWNYYRATLDREWLQAKGYAVLRDVADFFVSKVEHDEGDDSWHLRDVVGLDGSTVSADNNGFTNNLVRLALRYAIEASYELQFGVSGAWLDAYYHLPAPTFGQADPDGLPDEALYHVLRRDADQAPGDASADAKLMEPLFALLPYYSQLFYAPETGNTVENSARANLDFHAARLDPAPDVQAHPFNVALRALLSASYAQYDPAYVQPFAAALAQFLDGNTSGLWGHVGRDRAADATLCAVLLFTVLQGGMGLNVVGGVAETRFYYEELRLDASAAANLPATWKSLRASAVGRDGGRTFVTTNSLLYAA